jgi:hypothetical protein
LFSQRTRPAAHLRQATALLDGVQDSLCQRIAIAIREKPANIALF